MTIIKQIANKMEPTMRFALMMGLLLWLTKPVQSTTMGRRH